MPGIGNRRLLERAGTKAPVDTTTLATGGHLNPEQSDRFIDYVIDVTMLFKSGIRVRRMNRDRADLDKIAIGTRVIRKATEGVAPGTTVGVTTSKRSLSVVEIILPVDVTFSFFEDNIEQENFEDHLMRMQAITLGNDLEDLAISGDETSGDPFVNINTGWLALLTTANDRIFTAGGSDDFRNIVFKGMLATMPVKFKQNKAALRFFVSVTNEEKYRFQLGQRQTPGGDQILLQGGMVTYDGIGVVGAAYMPDDKHLLSIPDNLVFGIRRDVNLGIFKNERRRAFEYTWTMRIDYELVETSATVLAMN
jgi:hypothetical protein